MKKLPYFVLLIIITIFTSCSSDEEDSTTNQSSILGKWQLTKIVRNTGEITLSDCRKEETLTFFDNGNIENYFVDNDPCDYSTKTLQYSINNNAISFSIEGEGNNGATFILVARIISLTDTKLEYEYVSDNEVGDYPDSEKETQEYKKI